MCRRKHGMQKYACGMQNFAYCMQKYVMQGWENILGKFLFTLNLQEQQRNLKSQYVLTANKQSIMALNPMQWRLQIEIYLGNSNSPSTILPKKLLVKYDVNTSVRVAYMNFGCLKVSFLLFSCKLQLYDKKQPGEYKTPPVWSTQHCIRWGA